MDETSVRSKMQNALDHLISEIGTIRTGRATPSLVEGLEVMVYGGQQRLKIREIANITAPDSNMLVISPWDKSIIGEIRNGILGANIGLNPSIDGEILRIVIAPMTTEDREKFVKLMMAKLEDGRVKIRQIRGDAMHSIKKGFEEKEITEDVRGFQEKTLQKITDEFIAKIEEIGAKKKSDLLQV